MLCPKCHGAGQLWVGNSLDRLALIPCDYEGCMGGSIDCCDGLQENDPVVRKDPDCLVRLADEPQSEAI